MNVYLEKGKATTGEIMVEVCSTPNGDGYWYQSGGAKLDPVSGGTPVTAPGGRELLRNSIYVPLNNKADDYAVYPFTAKVAIRNTILALHNEDSDYEGRVYYDNIRYFDAEDPDDIDTEENFMNHADRIFTIAASENAKPEQILSAVKAAENPLITKELFNAYGLVIEDLIAAAEEEGSVLSDEEKSALTEKLGEPSGTWKKESGGWTYTDAKGRSYVIDGKTYTFDAKGYCVNP